MPTARDLAMSNLLRVFGERDPAARRSAIAETYADDVVFSDADGDLVGHAAIDARVESLLAGAPGVVFSAVEPLYEGDGWVALAWALGPEAAEPLVRGVDVMSLRDGRIATLRTLLAAS
jgi:SnoaL-like domain